MLLSLSQTSTAPAQQSSKSKPAARGASQTECDTAIRNARMGRRGQYRAAMQRCRAGGVGAI
jgi:hypothetical protein